MNPPKAARRRLGPEEDTMTNRRSMIYAKFEVFEEQLAHCYFMLHERFIANPPLAKLSSGRKRPWTNCSIIRSFAFAANAE